jgi:hypothetical protein
LLVNVPLQEGSQRKSSEAIAEEIEAKSPTRSAAKGLAQSFQFIINKINPVIFSFFNFTRTTMILNFKFALFLKLNLFKSSILSMKNIQERKNPFSI